jgi:hypothetical protein
MATAPSGGMTDELRRLRNKLCRELVQSEHSAIVHCAREAKRLGDVPPAHALRALSEHAEQLRPTLEPLLGFTRGKHVADLVGEMFSLLRHGVFDRLLDTERSYRGTLLGLKHGVDAVRLLREVTVCSNETDLLRWCDRFLAERLPLIERAEHAMVWFAERPGHALKSGLAIALAPGHASRTPV